MSYHELFKNTIDVINFSMSNKFYRNLILQNKQIFNCISKFNNKYINEIDKLNIIGKLKVDLYNSDIIDVSMLGNVKKLNLSNCYNIKDISNLGNCENINDFSMLGNVKKLNYMNNINIYNEVIFTSNKMN